MTAISYRDYAFELYSRIQNLRRSTDTVGSIEIAVCRNSFCYRSAETVGTSWSRQTSYGPLNSKSDLKPDLGGETAREIEAFFALPVIYAYSDAALSVERSPLIRGHWDGTVALVEVKYQTSLTTWHQRMLFIGFSDPIHADFTVGIDHDLFVTGQNKGTQLFEWTTERTSRERVADSEVALSTASQDAISPSFRQRLSGLIQGRWLAQLRHRGRVAG
ncbi:hypothetical protein ABUK73_17745 [Agrobacterium sp. BA1120]|uniref:hypothetical protein n=1 Tax=Agrobacterium sp. BA1120 TaxID=3228927 RepID=UPI003369C9E4